MKENISERENHLHNENHDILYFDIFNIYKVSIYNIKCTHFAKNILPISMNGL